MLMALNMEMYDEYWKRYPYDKFFKGKDDTMLAYIKKAIRIIPLEKNGGYYYSPTTHGVTFLAMGLELGFHEIVKSTGTFWMPDHGICDNPSQFIRAYEKDLRAGKSQRFVLFTPVITKYDPAAAEGFNVDKWGEYFGKKPVKQFQLLEHNPHVRTVWVFCVYEFRWAPGHGPDEEELNNKKSSKGFELRGVVANPKILETFKLLEGRHTTTQVFIYPLPKSTKKRFLLTGVFQNPKMPLSWYGAPMLPAGMPVTYDNYIGISEDLLAANTAGTVATWLDSLLWNMIVTK